VSLLHPSLPLLAAAALQAVVPARWRGPTALAGAGLALLAVVALPEGAALTVSLLGHELRLLAADRLARVFALVFAALAGLATLYAAHVRRAGEHAATLVYAAASLGVVFAGDWVTLFLGWELMAVASTAVVWSGGAPRSRAAGLRYALVHLVAGSLLFAGIALLAPAGLARVGPVPEGAAFWLLLGGVAINAAIPPLHAWLTDAYPEASITGAVFLSAFTTKTAVYVLLRAFPGAEALALAGALMAVYGVVFAVLENDVRRLLAYHIVSQVGYMVAGVGMGTALALDGATAHAFCHILYKGLLFMAAGALLHATGRRRLGDLGGLGRALPAVAVLYMAGALSISGAPLFNGFVSKSMVVSAAAEGGFPAVELLLTLASVGTFLSVGLKLPWLAFVAPAREAPPAVLRPVPGNMILAMGLAAAACVALGLVPGWLYARLPLGAGYEPFTVDHVARALQLMLGTGAAFLLLRRRLGADPRVSLDADWLYRRPLRRALARAILAAGAAGSRVETAGRAAAAAAATFARDPSRPLGGVASGDPFDPDLRRLPVGATVLWIVVALGLAAVLVGR
jgi:multicomponent Na+:H+ antiporter subunit D